MKTVVAGCGKTGSAIISSLCREGHEVVAIDTNREKIERLVNSNDIMGICSGCTDYRTLTEIGMRDTELFIAAAGSDEINMLACLLAKRLGAAHTVARIRDRGVSSEGLSFIKKELDIDLLINPELMTAQAIYDLLHYPSAIKTESFTRRSFEAAEFLVHKGTALEGAVLSELRECVRVPFLVYAVLRGGRAYIPDGGFTLHAGDKIGIIASPEDLTQLLKTLGMLGRRSRGVMLLGASRTAIYLAELLSKGGCSVKLIEKNRARCEKAVEELPDSVRVVCGDGSSHELLEEEGLLGTDAFCALTGMDEENILLSYYASSAGVRNVIGKVNGCAFRSISEKLGLDCTVTPKSIVADRLTSYARALSDSVGSQIETMYTLFDGAVEALEFSVGEEKELCGRRLSELELRQGILIAGIIRGEEKIIPCGSDTVESGDKVIVIASGMQLKSLKEVLR